MSDYDNSKVLVTTGWVAEHLNDENLRIVEVDVETDAYEDGHIPGAIAWNWNTQLCDQVRRTIIVKDEFEKLMGESGVSNDTTVIIYGDNNNWFAAWAFWQLEIYGHADVRLMDGGRKKWELEGRDISTDTPSIESASYRASEPDDSIRAYREEVLGAVRESAVNLIDVRSKDEFTGKIIAPPGLPETAQRGGHIPTAANIPWSSAVNEDGSFKSVDELKEIYSAVDPSKRSIAYCRIGERSSHTWFVLKYLLGHEDSKNYDGSWTEWGNLVDAPIATGE